MFDGVHQHFHTIKWVGKILMTSSLPSAGSIRGPGQNSELLRWDIQIQIVRWWSTSSTWACCIRSLVPVQLEAPSQKTIWTDRTSACACTCVWCGWCRCSDCIGVVGRECVQIAQLTKAALDVCHVDLDVILKATRNTKRTTVWEMFSSWSLT